MNFSGILVGAAVFFCFWGILEMHQQEKWVLRGWFPENPKRHAYYEVLRQKKGEKHIIDSVVR